MTAGKYDAEYYETLQSGVRALLIMTGDRLSTDEVGLFTDLVDANEPGVALEMLVDSLLASGSLIEAAALEGMRSLASTMGIALDGIERLTTEEE
ncbi:MAG: hypothetical protein M3063_02175 [Actinomycetota bacterium]|nr:hypothetical protein [Actinomycetota bacterium]